MSTDFSIRPVGIPAPAQIITTSNPAANEAVPTELPVSQTVAAADTGAAVRNDIANNENVSRQVVFDQASASLVFQVVDDRTDAVVNQFPDDAMLRRRAYFNALDRSKAPLTHPLNTDRNV